MGDTQDADQTGSGTGTDGVDSRAEQVDTPAQEPTTPLPDDWEAQAEIVDPDGAADDPNDGDTPEGDAEIDEALRQPTLPQQAETLRALRLRYQNDRFTQGC